MQVCAFIINITLQERVAVKIPNKAENGMHLQLLLKEAAILANLKHPNIIKMHGIVLDPVKLV